MAEAGLEFLSTAGTVVVVDYLDIKQVDFVREFGGAGGEKRAFLTRPKMEGLWIRLTFRDHDVLEGVIPNNLLQIPRPGITLTPPDFGGNRQRVFVPRSALTDVVVLGVVGSPLNKAVATKKRVETERQLPMFE